MARNQVYKNADTATLPVPAGTVSGQPVRISTLNGVALTNEPTAYLASPTYPAVAGPWVEDPSSNKTGYASVALQGAFNIPVATTTALNVGDPVYIITSGNTLTTTANSGANPLFGVALTPKGTTAGQLVVVRITN